MTRMKWLAYGELVVPMQSDVGAHAGKLWVSLCISGWCVSPKQAKPPFKACASSKPPTSQQTKELATWWPFTPTSCTSREATACSPVWFWWVVQVCPRRSPRGRGRSSAACVLETPYLGVVGPSWLRGMHITRQADSLHVLSRSLEEGSPMHGFLSTLKHHCTCAPAAGAGRGTAQLRPQQGEGMGFHRTGLSQGTTHRAGLKQHCTCPRAAPGPPEVHGEAHSLPEAWHPFFCAHGGVMTTVQDTQ